MQLHSVTNETAIVWLARRLETLLETQSVTWLLSGGSAIEAAVKVAQILATNPNLSRLAVSLVDERYGPVGHADSNWQQLLDAGFTLQNATLIPVLEGASLAGTTAVFGRRFGELRSASQYMIGLFGMGSDGHTAGILPGSPALTATELACGYDWTDYQRVTLTPVAVRQCDEAVLFAYGQPKWPQIESLLYQTVELAVQPAQILKDIATSSVFSDFEVSA